MEASPKVDFGSTPSLALFKLFFSPSKLQCAPKILHKATNHSNLQMEARVSTRNALRMIEAEMGL